MTFKQFKTKIRKFIGLINEANVVSNPIEANSSKSWSDLFNSPKFLRDYVAHGRLDFYDEVASLIKQQTEDASIQKIIDIGCGTGHLLGKLHEKFPDSDFYGADFTQDGLTVAQKIFPKAKYIFYDIYEEKKEWESQFDIVICTEVLEHLLHPAKALKNLISFIKPNGGMLIICVPDGRKDTYSGHIQFWSPESWEVFIDSNLPKNFIASYSIIEGGATNLTLIKL